jgi:hypothetical protein
MQLVIDERAEAPQRDALLKILSGQETEEMATVWWVLGAMCPTKHEPLFKPITFEVDVEARRAHLEIPGFLEMSGEPIRNPVTGAEHAGPHRPARWFRVPDRGDRQRNNSMRRSDRIRSEE